MISSADVDALVDLVDKLRTRGVTHVKIGEIELSIIPASAPVTSFDASEPSRPDLDDDLLFYSSE